MATRPSPKGQHSRRNVETFSLTSNNLGHSSTLKRVRQPRIYSLIRLNGPLEKFYHIFYASPDDLLGGPGYCIYHLTGYIP
jgi:hypothetical protein